MTLLSVAGFSILDFFLEGIITCLFLNRGSRGDHYGMYQHGGISRSKPMLWGLYYTSYHPHHCIDIMLNNLGYLLAKIKHVSSSMQPQ